MVGLSGDRRRICRRASVAASAKPGRVEAPPPTVHHFCSADARRPPGVHQPAGGTARRCRLVMDVMTRRMLVVVDPLKVVRVWQPPRFHGAGPSTAGHADSHHQHHLHRGGFRPTRKCWQGTLHGKRPRLPRALLRRRPHGRRNEAAAGGMSPGKPPFTAGLLRRVWPNLSRVSAGTVPPAVRHVSWADVAGDPQEAVRPIARSSMIAGARPLTSTSPG